MVQRYKEWLKKIPIPICGLILGLVSLGNLLSSEGYTQVGSIYGWSGIMLMFFFMTKVFFTMKHTFKTLEDPIIASVAPTFTMAWMVICVFLSGRVSEFWLLQWIWVSAVILHFLLMIYFVAVHIFPVKIELEHIYPSWFITFVGIGVIPNTSEIFVKAWGKFIIWIALFFYLILLPIILKRVLQGRRLGDMHESTLPLITIMMAPGSLCLAGYLSLTTERKSFVLILLLFLLSQGIYFCTLFFLRRLLLVRFYPSYAAFTFPLVISATAMYKIYLLFHTTKTVEILLHGLFLIETLLAVSIVTYVFLRYLKYLMECFIPEPTNDL